MRQTTMTLILLLFLMGCVSQSPEIFLGDATCALPCWYGLTPGKTTVAESQTILKSLPFVSSASIETITLQGVTSIRWSFTGGAIGNGILVFDKDQRIQEIRLRTTGLHLGTVIDSFGSPNSVWADYFPGERIHYGLSLYYPHQGVVVTTDDQPNSDPSKGMERITRDLQVSLVQFYAPMSAEAFLRDIENRSPENVNYILNHLQPWPGFGDNVIDIESP